MHAWLSLSLALILLAPHFPAAQDVDAEGAALREALRRLSEYPGSSEVAGALLELHDRAWAAGDVTLARDAIARIDEWLAEREADAPLDLVRQRRSLAIHLRELGHLAPARSLLERALAASEEHEGPDAKGTVDVLRELAVVVELGGDPAGARPLYERVIHRKEADPDFSPRSVAISHDDIALCLIQLGAYDEARDHLDRALAIKREANEPQTSLANTLDNLMSLLFELGDYRAAETHAEQILAIREASLPPDHPRILDARKNLALILARLGEHGRALTLTEECVAAWQRTGRTHSPSYAGALLAQAWSLHQLGRHEQTLDAAKLALEASEAVLGPDHIEVAACLDVLGRALVALGRPSEAKRCYERAVATQERRLGPLHRKVVAMYQALAAVLLETDGPEAALDVIRRTRETMVAIGRGEALDRAELEALASAVHSRAGHLEEARDALQLAYELRRSHTPHHSEIGMILQALVRLELDLGRTDDAWEHARALIEHQGHLQRTLAGLSEREALDDLATRRMQFAAILSAADAAGHPESAYPAVLDTKGRVARIALSAKDWLRDAGDADLGALARELAEAEERRASLALAQGGETDADTLARLRTERNHLDRTLRLAARDGDHALLRHTITDVQRALPPRSALVDLVVETRHVPARDAEGDPTPGGWSELRATAYVVRRDTLRAVELGPYPPLRRAIDAHMTDMHLDARLRGVSVQRPRADGASDGGDPLLERIWRPLRAHLGDTDTVFVAADGAFGRLPFETIRDERGRFLIEDRGFVYVSDGGAVARTAAATPELGAGLLAVGDVDYDAARSDGERPATTARWSRLSATGPEARAIAEVHRRARGEDDATVLTGANASETSLREALSGPAVVHLATHGYFGDERHSVGDRGPAGPGDGNRAPLDVGLLSGLVLAGANTPSTGVDDGYLTAAEVAALDLGPADLVVLSACETGLGRPHAGEGLLGLRRAFHVAGAETVVSSLWSVNDESTRALMEAFYDNLLRRGMGRLEALRAAQLEMLERNRARDGRGMPSTWGAFVLSGEWR